MISPTKIIITVEKRLNDEVDFNGGKLYLDPTYRPEWNAFSYGTVVSAPLKNVYVEEDFFYNV